MCSALVREVMGSYPGPVKSNTELAMARHRCNFSSKGAVLPKRIVEAMAKQTRYRFERNTVSIMFSFDFEAIAPEDLFTVHVIPVTTTQIRNSVIVQRVKLSKILFPK